MQSDVAQLALSLPNVEEVGGECGTKDTAGVNPE